MEVRIRMVAFVFLAVVFLFSIHSIFDVDRIHACDLPVQNQPCDASQLEKGRITVDLTTIFTQNDIAKIETSVNICRVSINQKIQQFQHEISNLLQYKANLQGYANIRDMIKRIETLKREKKDILETLGQDLTQISFRGMYGTILEMAPGTSRKELLMAARRMIAPHAVHDLRGVAISAVSEVSSSRIVFDCIVAETSGEMDIETPVFEERKFFKGKTQLLYVAVVSVKPLKGAMQRVDGNDNLVVSKVVDILMPGGAQRYKQELAGVTDSSYAEKKKAKLSKIVDQWADVIRNGNSMEAQREQSILMNLDRKLADKDDQIRSAYGTVERSRKDLVRLYSNIGFSLCNVDAEGCLSQANKYIDSKIEELVDRSMAEKEKELVFRKDRIRGEGDPAQEIRDLASDLCRNLKTTYGQREQFLRLSVVESGALVKDVKDQGYYIQRHPRQGWIYPYADDRGDLWLLVAMNFRVERGGRPTASVGSPTVKKVAESKVKVSKKLIPGTFTNSIGMKFVPISEGTFMMGSALSASDVVEKYGGKEDDVFDCYPQQRVTISKPFYMQTTEVTQGQWKALMESNQSEYKEEKRPAQNISWNDAKEFIRRLNKKENTDKYRLPTEAEWEYACRAGTKTPFSTGDRISTNQANFHGSSLGSLCLGGGPSWGPVAVGGFAPNAWGLYDMHGNVAELCQDWYKEGYPAGPVNDPQGPQSGKYRVLRGGSWSFTERRMRSADRVMVTPDFRNVGFGFRVARVN